MAEAILPISTMPAVAPVVGSGPELASLRAGQLLLGHVAMLSDGAAATVTLKQGALALLLDILLPAGQAKPALGSPVRLEVVSAPSPDNPEMPLTVKWLPAGGPAQQASGLGGQAPSQPLPILLSFTPSAFSGTQAAPAPEMDIIVEPAAQASTLLKADRPPPQASEPSPAASPRDVLLPRIAAALTIQDSPARLFAELAAMRDHNDLSQPLRGAIDQVLGARASTGDLLRPETLLGAILRSGLFLERNLSGGSSSMAQTAQQFGGDFKNVLLGLREALLGAADMDASAPPRATGTAEAPPPLRGDWPRNAAPMNMAALPSSGYSLNSPAETVQNLLSRTESALARLDLLQFASLNDAGSGEAPRSWMVEVPLAFGQETAILGLRVEEDGRLDLPAQERTWRIAFSLDSTGTGPVDALVTWRAGRVGVDLWAERGEAVRTIRDSMDHLAQGLVQSGLAIDEIHCRTGRPTSRRTGTGRLLDARS